MQRLTRPLDGGSAYVVDETLIQMAAEGVGGPAIDRLAHYENVFADLQREQAKIAAELDALRAAGKEKTVRFRELLGRKLTHNMLLVLFETNGL